MTDAAYDLTDDGLHDPALPGAGQDAGPAAPGPPPLWLFSDGSDAFQPTGDPLTDNVVQALRYNIGLDDPASADSALQPLIDSLRVPSVTPQPGVLGDGLTQLALASNGAPQSQPGPATTTGDVQQQQLIHLLLRPNGEGRRWKVYKDTTDHLTVGVGHKVLPQDNLKQGDVIGDDRVNQFLRQDTATALGQARSQAAQAGITDPNFIAPLAAVNFQLGSGWTGLFPKAWNAMQQGDYETAAREVALGQNGGKSKWMKETPNRVEVFQGALRALPPKPGAD
jgi:GH24 family phage-related lysozyme (muramidase)